MAETLAVEALTKTFGRFTALAGVDFTIESGEIFGFLGPNGAGKSTTIKILSTLLRPTSGSARLAGLDVLAHADAVRQRIGIVFQDPSLDDRLTAEENLKFHAMLYDVPSPVFRARASELLAMVDLVERRNSRVRTFSGGMKRRLEIVRGVLHCPRVLFMDEPTLGLDPQTRTAIWEHIRRLRDEAGLTVFMTTHYMEEAENCDRIAIIDHGKIQAIDTPAALKRTLGGSQVVLAGDEALAKDLATAYGLVLQQRNAEIHFPLPVDSTFVPRMLMDFNGRIASIQVKQPSLEDVFIKLTGRTIRDQEAEPADSRRQGMRFLRGGAK
jgi:ABC-2 type transport system ATP-binding protein